MTPSTIQAIFGIVSINATAASSSSLVRLLFTVLSGPRGEPHLPALTSARWWDWQKALWHEKPSLSLLSVSFVHQQTGSSYVTSLIFFFSFSELLSQAQNLRSIVSFVCKTFLYFSFKALVSYAVRYIFVPPIALFSLADLQLSPWYTSWGFFSLSLLQCFLPFLR